MRSEWLDFYLQSLLVIIVFLVSRDIQIANSNEMKSILGLEKEIEEDWYVIFLHKKDFKSPEIVDAT